MKRQITVALVVLFIGSAAHAADAGKEAVETRRAALSLIGKNFKPLGAIVKGEAEFDAATVKTQVKRVAFLTEFLSEAFPAESNLGEPASKAKPEIWRNQDDFKKRLANFQKDAAELASVMETETTASAAFKKAVGTLAQNCKGCHDEYKLK